MAPGGAVPCTTARGVRQVAVHLAPLHVLDPLHDELRHPVQPAQAQGPPADVDPPEVKALAGYVAVPNGEVVEFALVLNGGGYVTKDGYRTFWAALAERLGNYPVGPDVATLGPR